MAESLIDKLPQIITEGKKEVKKILVRLSRPNKISLQTNEFVLPIKDYSRLSTEDVEVNSIDSRYNRLIYGDNILVMEALLSKAT